MSFVTVCNPSKSVKARHSISAESTTLHAASKWLVNHCSYKKTCLLELMKHLKLLGEPKQHTKCSLGGKIRFTDSDSLLSSF